MAITLAEKIGAKLLPALLDKVDRRQAVENELQALTPTVQKCAQLLQSIRPEQAEQLAPEVNQLQSALDDAVRRPLSGTPQRALSTLAARCCRWRRRWRGLWRGLRCGLAAAARRVRSARHRRHRPFNWTVAGGWSGRRLGV